MSEFVTIASYVDLSGAYVARTKLESAGVYCYLANEHLVGVQWLYSNAVGGVELRVPKNDADWARELLLENDEPEVLELDANVEPDDHEIEAGVPTSVCPMCGGTDNEVRSLAKQFGAISLLVGLPLCFSFKKKRCRSCGHSWK